MLEIYLKLSFDNVKYYEEELFKIMEEIDNKN